MSGCALSWPWAARFSTETSPFFKSLQAHFQAHVDCCRPVFQTQDEHAQSWVSFLCKTFEKKKRRKEKLPFHRNRRRKTSEKFFPEGHESESVVSVCRGLPTRWLPSCYLKSRAFLKMAHALSFSPYTQSGLGLSCQFYPISRVSP